MINPGNSGGPLLNVLGEFIGINTVIRGDAQNIGFAIPVDQLRDIALIGRRPGDELPLRLRRDDRAIDVTLTLASRPLPDGGRLAFDRLGVRIRPLPDGLARDLGLRGDRGLVVADVDRGSPAGQVGIQAADVLVAVGHRYVGTVEDLGLLLDGVAPGDPLELTVLRLDRRRGKYYASGTVRTR